MCYAKSGEASPHFPKPRGLDITEQHSYASLVFTGLIEEVGKVVAVRESNHGTQLQIAAPRIAKSASRSPIEPPGQDSLSREP